ncbi:MAG: tetratricopeptide repeat protein [Bacteroidia bacterium]|nr:tetratricopeptide repeat protein [Bacteroidia bacterium]
MKTSNIYILFLVFILTSCGASKMTTSKGDLLLASGDYAGALAFYKEKMASLSPDDRSLYRNMAIANSKLGNHAEACRLAAYVPTSGDSLLLNSLATSLLQENRQHEVIPLIEENRNIFLNSWGADSVNVHLAKYYTSINDSRIVEVYPLLNSPAAQAECLECYIKKADLPTAEIKKNCEQVLSFDSSHVVAIRLLATAYYDEAESGYNSSMAQYNKKKNTATYAKLVKELKALTPTYIKCKDRLEKLRTMGVAEANDLKRLVNVYNRLNQEEKAKAVERQIKKLKK